MDVTSSPKKEKGPLPTLFWVNKDASSTSLSNSKSDGGRAINSYVQRKIKENGPLKQRKRKPQITDEATAQEALLSSGTAPERVKAGRTHDSSESSSASPSLADLRSTFSLSPTSTDSRSVADKESDSKNGKRAGLRLARSICNEGEAVDPFNATVIPINARVRELAQSFLDVTDPAAWHPELKTPDFKSPRLRSASGQILWDCISSELHMASLLAVTASRVEHFNLIPLGRQGTSAFTHRAIVALRAYIETHPGTVDPRVILDIFFLCLAEAYRYNTPGYMTHLRAVKYLVNLAGGLNTLDPPIRRVVVITDIYLSTEQLSAPVFPLDWDPGAISPSSWSKIEVDSTLLEIGRGILSISDEHVVPVALRKIVQDIAQCIQVAQYTWSHPESRKENGNWVFMRHIAILHRLDSLVFDMKQQFRKAEVLRITLIQWLILTMTNHGRRRSVKVITPRLKKALEISNSNGQRWSEYSGLLLWILLTGTVCAEGMAEEKWFSEQAMAVSSMLQVQTESQLREFLQRFLYLHILQQKDLQELARRIGEYTILSIPKSARGPTIRL